MRGIPPWGKRRARAQVAGIAARTVPGIVRGVFPTGCAVAKLWCGPFAARSAAGEGRGEGFPRPTEDDGADRGAMRGIPPWGKRRARAQVAGIAARTVPGIVRGVFPTGCAVAKLWCGPFAARSAAGEGRGEGFPRPTEDDGADRGAMRGIPPWGKRRARAQVAGIAARTVPGIVRGAFPTGCAVAKLWCGPFAARSAAGEGRGEGFPRPTEDDGADRGAMRGIPPWGKRRARAQVAGIAARTVPGIVRGVFPTGCAVAKLWCGPFAARSAAGEGRGEGFPRPTEDDGADRGAMRGISPWGKRRARAQVAGIAARTVPGIVRGVFPTGCAVAKLWCGPFAARSAAGEGRGEGFPRPTEDDGADRGAMRGIPPWGKRRARAQVAGIAARTVPGIVRGAFPTGG